MLVPRLMDREEVVRKPQIGLGWVENFVYLILCKITFQTRFINIILPNGTPDQQIS